MADAFTFDGTDMSGKGLTLMRHPRPLGGVQSTSFTDGGIGGGRGDGGGTSHYTLTLPCIVEGASVSALQSNLDDIFRLTDPGEVSEAKLTIDSISGRYFIAIREGTPEINHQNPTTALINIAFGISTSAYDSTQVDSNDTSNPTISTDPDTFNITGVGGSAPGTVVWYVRNTVGSDVTGDIKANNTTLSEFITWNGTLEDGRWLKIGSEDSDGRYLYTFEKSTAGGADPTALSYADAISGITATGGDWPRLKASVTNAISIEGLTSGTVRYQYRNRYRGG